MTKQSEIVERLEALHKIDGRMIVCMERSDIAEAAQTITDQAALIDELVLILSEFRIHSSRFIGLKALAKIEQWKAG